MFHKSEKTFKLFIGGIGSGKTLAGCIEGIRYAIENPGSIGIVTAPSYRLLQDTTIRTFFEQCPLILIKNFIKSENRVILINSSEIWFRSAEDPEKLRGPNIAWFFLDEAALCSHMTWKILIGRLRQQGFKPKAWITTTPKGFNWIWEEFVHKHRPENYDVINCTTRENIYLTEEFISSLEQSYSGVFLRQELLGEFVAMEGAVYPNFSRLVHVTDNVPVAFSETMAGVDWGFTNPSVILVIGKDYNGRFWIVEEFYKKRVTDYELIQEAKALKNKHSISTFHADPSEPQFIEKFRSEGLRTSAAINSLLPGINKIASLLEKQADGKPMLFVHRNCVNTIAEFEGYRYGEEKEGRQVREGPIKIMDHTMDALRYAVMSDFAPSPPAAFGRFRPMLFYEKRIIEQASMRQESVSVESTIDKKKLGIPDGDRIVGNDSSVRFIPKKQIG